MPPKTDDRPVPPATVQRTGPAPDVGSDLPPEKEYERLNPGAGGSPSQQQERDKPNPRVTRDDGGAAIPGSQNEDLKGSEPRGPRGAST